MNKEAEKDEISFPWSKKDKKKVGLLDYRFSVIIEGVRKYVL